MPEYLVDKNVHPHQYSPSSGHELPMERRAKVVRGKQGVLKFLFLRSVISRDNCVFWRATRDTSLLIASLRTHTAKRSTVRFKLHTQHVKPRVCRLLWAETQENIQQLSQIVWFRGCAPAIRWRSHSAGASVGGSHHGSPHVY